MMGDRPIVSFQIGGEVQNLKNILHREFIKRAKFSFGKKLVSFFLLALFCPFFYPSMVMECSMLYFSPSFSRHQKCQKFEKKYSIHSEKK